VNRNKRAKLRGILIKYINNISISDMDSVRTQAGMLVLATSQTDEITRDIQVNIGFYLEKNIYLNNLYVINIGRHYKSMHSIDTRID
jgi:hypothetical protein